MNINNFTKPKFEEFVGGFRVTLFKSPQKTAHITTQKTAQKTRVKAGVKTRVKTSDLILDLIKANRSIAREQTAKALNLTIDGIYWNIRKLKNEGKLKRIGPDKGGH